MEPTPATEPIQSDPHPPDAQHLEALAVSIAQETAELARTVRERVTRGRDLDTKSSATDVVTEGDTACEDLVRRRLARERPGDAVFGEEGGVSGEGRVRWIVDPIDGTVNYTHGLPWYSVSLGVEVDGRPVAGAVVEPVSGRVWSAARGRGATCDGQPLGVSSLDRLELAVVATGPGYDPDRRARQAALIARVAQRIGDIRRCGSAALDLCAVAAGWVDAFYEHGLNPWDLAAGALIAEEAGAVVRRPHGPDDPDPDGLGAAATLAAPPALAGPLTTLLAAEGASSVF